MPYLHAHKHLTGTSGSIRPGLMKMSFSLIPVVSRVERREDPQRIETRERTAVTVGGLRWLYALASCATSPRAGRLWGGVAWHAANSRGAVGLPSTCLNPTRLLASRRANLLLRVRPHR